MSSIGESIERIRSLMPAEVQRQWAERDAKDAKLREELRQEAVDAIASLADAIRFPNIARADLEAAQKHVVKALSIAAVLDPE
jgi:hypothetical protein